jgi:LPXTG-motif cell wall-anchored protein
MNWTLARRGNLAVGSNMRGLSGACPEFSTFSVGVSLKANAAAGDCQPIADMAATYERLSNKTDKSASTRACAATYAVAARQMYVDCMAAKGAAQAVGVTPSTPVTTTPVQPTPSEPQGILDTLVATLMPSATPQPTTGSTVQTGIGTGTIIAGAAGVALLGLALFMLMGRKRSTSSSSSSSTPTTVAAPATVAAAAAIAAPRARARARARAKRRSPRRRAAPRQRRTVRRRTSRRSYTRVMR